MACGSGNKELVKYLVEHGAEINKERRNAETPIYLMYALMEIKI